MRRRASFAPVGPTGGHPAATRREITSLQMRSTVDLVKLPYALAVRRLMTPDAFLTGLRHRGVSLSVEGLEGLHRLRLVEPFFRVRRDGHEIAVAQRSRERDAYSIAHWQHTSRRDIEEA